MYQQSMLTTSKDDERDVDGEPTEEGGLPGGASSTSGSGNGSSTGNGQGSGGQGNRGKSWDNFNLPGWED